MVASSMNMGGGEAGSRNQEAGNTRSGIKSQNTRREASGKGKFPICRNAGKPEGERHDEPRHVRLLASCFRTSCFSPPRRQLHVRHGVLLRLRADVDLAALEL